jgi:plasmid maintenance system antidote protein VapI
VVLLKRQKTQLFELPQARLSGEMALRIEKAFGVKMDTLMRMQSSYDIAQTRKREKEIRVQRIRQTAHAHL